MPCAERAQEAVGALRTLAEQGYTGVIDVLGEDVEELGHGGRLKEGLDELHAAGVVGRQRRRHELLRHDRQRADGGGARRQRRRVQKLQDGGDSLENAVLSFIPNTSELAYLGLVKEAQDEMARQRARWPQISIIQAWLSRSVFSISFMILMIWFGSVWRWPTVFCQMRARTCFCGARATQTAPFWGISPAFAH